MIEAKGICKAFNGKTVLKNFNAIFETDKISFLIGASASGKTTLLRIILGLETADLGKIIKDAKSFGVVFQEDRLFERLTIKENLAYVIDCPLDMELVKALDLTEYLDKPVKDLSGGTKRRVSILRALSVNPDTVIMDEPFTGLDEATKKTVLNAVKKYSIGKTVIISTHDKYIIEHTENSNIFEVN